MFRQMIALGAIALALSANASLAQTGGSYLITFEGVVTPQTPTMTVSIWATWADPQQEYLFGGCNYDLEAGEGEFVGGTLILGLEPPNKLGIPSGRTVTGAAIGQVYLPIWGGGNFDNPILLATYDWTTTDFTPRTVDFETTNTDNFVVVAVNTGLATQLFPQQFSPGRAQYFVPAPSTLALLGLGGLVAIRRRRNRGANNV